MSFLSKLFGRGRKEQPRVNAPTTEAAARAARGEGPPGRIDAYRRESLLGKGGMGEVWRSVHIATGDVLAIKIIRADPGDDGKATEERRERFRREAMTTSQLTSPHAIRIVDFGNTSEGGFFYAMELLNGVDLERLGRDHGAQPEARVAHLIGQACHALDEAHNAGLVHRDIKPENLFVSRGPGQEDLCKVLDFGLVKLLEEGADGSTFDRGDLARLTAAAATPGTPAYMAPEQVRPGAAIDHRADIYALACVAYFAVTGQPVFEGRMDTQLMFAHMTQEPDPPSQRLGRTIHGGFEALLLRNLAKSPDDRCQTMAEFADALRALQFDAPWDTPQAAAWWAKVNAA